MTKQWSWSVSGYNLARKRNDEIINLCKYAGMSGIEANELFVNSKTDNEIESIKYDYESAGLKLETFHLPMGPEGDILSFYETRRRQAVDYMISYYEKAAALGSNIVILSTGTLNAPPIGS